MGKVLLTGGLGYIGSHVAVELVEAGRDMVIIDDLSNSEYFVLESLYKLTGRQIPFEEGDIRDSAFLQKVFSKYDIAEVIHFAAKKAVGESMQVPLLYFDVNITGLLTLLKVLESNPVRKFIFSSSCTVYGTPDELPVTEDTPFGNTPSPYGKTKQMCEEILSSIKGKSGFDIVSLRYFNPVGAHESGMIGELPRGIPNNLVPFITQTCAGLRDRLSVFGCDYDTPDGSAIRDYIHVVDLAKAHVCAMEVETGSYEVFNIGTGKGYSVLEVLNEFQEVNNVKVPFKITDRRAGDVEIIYGDSSKANQVLGWKSELDLSRMLADAWRWQKNIKSLEY